MAATAPSAAEEEEKGAGKRRRAWTTPDRARAFTCPMEECDGPVCPFGGSDGAGEGDGEGVYWTCLCCGREALPPEVHSVCVHVDVCL